MAYTVILTPRVQRDLDDLPRRDRERLLRAIQRLETHPFGPPSKIKKRQGWGPVALGGVAPTGSAMT
jgi:mRNA-degrading endonuclease RelE of RelBE toxin-antitoxin system